MNIWNKVLLGLIAVMLLPLFWFSLVALKTHQHWRAAAKKIETRLDTEEKEIWLKKYGDPMKEDDESLMSLRIELYKYFVNRGRVWRHCGFKEVAGNEVKVEVTVPEKTAEYQLSDEKKKEMKEPEHRLKPETLVYVFDEAPFKDGGCYLGEFKVNSVNGNEVILEPTGPLTERALARIKAAQQVQGQGVKWTVREVLTNDRNDLFADIKKEDRDRILAGVPATIVQEYLNDGKDGNTRKLQDYEVLITELDRQRAILLENVEVAKRQVAYMQAASEDAKKQRLFRQDERATLMAELNRAKAERTAALDHQKSLEKELAQLDAKVGQLIADNRAIADEISRMQLKIIRQADRRAAVAAQ